MTNQTDADSELKEQFFDLIDKHFPKGECKERGQAMVLIAFALMAVTEHDKRLLDRLETEGPKKMINYEPGYGEGYNAAIADQAALLTKIRKEIE